MEQRGGRDLTGSPKLLDGKCWASKLLQVMNMGHETIFVLGFAFNYICLKHCRLSASFLLFS